VAPDGTVSALLQVWVKGKRVATLHDGDCFGEGVLYQENAKRTATVTTRTYCQLFLLSKSAVAAAFGAHPVAYQQLRTTVRELVQQHMQERMNRQRTDSKESRASSVLQVQGGGVSLESLSRKSRAVSGSGNAASAMCDTTHSHTIACMPCALSRRLCVM
jgi:CRP-like cAMP-binding protein